MRQCYGDAFAIRYELQDGIITLQIMQSNNG